MVRELLDRETESAKKGPGSEITRANYDFVFLRQESFGVVPEYVLRIVPKRKDKYLLRGQIWVDESTYRIRRIEGVPAKSPSLWIKGIHITLQYAEPGGMWVPISFDAIAPVRFLGEYTLAGLDGTSFRKNEPMLSCQPSWRTIQQFPVRAAWVVRNALLKGPAYIFVHYACWLLALRSFSAWCQSVPHRHLFCREARRASGATSKAPNGGQDKTALRKWPGTREFYSAVSRTGQPVLARND